MARIAVVGVDGCGKTVLMSALGVTYVHPDKYGFHLAAEDIETYNLCEKLMAVMRQGEWPPATGLKIVANLNWQLRRRRNEESLQVCDVSFLDYGGEIYRLAFGKHTDEQRKPHAAKIAALRDHISNADAVILLVNLKDVISGNLADERTTEMLWITRSIVDLAVPKVGLGKTVMVFSQFDKFSGIVERCGGLRAAYHKYFGLVESIYPQLALLTVSVVDKTVVDDVTGLERPAPDFTSVGLDGLMEWMVSTIPGHENDISDIRERPVKLWAGVNETLQRLNEDDRGAVAERLETLRKIETDLVELESCEASLRATAATDAEIASVHGLCKRQIAVETKIVAILSKLSEATLDAVRRQLAALTESGEISAEDAARGMKAVTVWVLKQKSRKAAARRGKIALLFAVILAVCAGTAYFGFRHWQKVEAARQAELQHKVSLGYSVRPCGRKNVAVWLPDVRVPMNPRLKTDRAEGSYVAVTPGYVWQRGTMRDVWQTGVVHPACSDVRAGETEGNWVTDLPGYRVDGNQRLAWTAGLRHPQNGDLISETAEGKWRCLRAGYVWIGGTNASWRAGLRHPADSGLLSKAERNVWEAVNPGYVWDGNAHAVWKPGLAYPERTDVVADFRQDTWRTSKPGCVVDENHCAVWKAGLVHPSDPRLVSDRQESVWRCTVPGFVCTEGTNVEWRAGVVHPEDSRLVSDETPGTWTSTHPGYVWNGGSRAIWKPGAVHPNHSGVYASATEGEWRTDRAGYAVSSDGTPFWRSGIPHPADARLVSDITENTWRCLKPGYVWRYGTTVEWNPGQRHPNNDNLEADATPDRWCAVKSGYRWNGGTGVSWQSGLRHRDNQNLVSTSSEGVWKSTRPGYVWNGGSSERWNAGSRHPDHEHVIAGDKSDSWFPESGYEWVNPNNRFDLSVTPKQETVNVNTWTPPVATPNPITIPQIPTIQPIVPQPVALPQNLSILPVAPQPIVIPQNNGFMPGFRPPVAMPQPVMRPGFGPRPMMRW